MAGRRLAIVGDMHIVDMEDASPGDRAMRLSFISSFTPAEEVVEYLNASGVDHSFFAGDLTDWFSVANAERALALLRTLAMPWDLTPGNHDLEDLPSRGSGNSIATESRQWWADHGVPLGDRVVEGDGVRVLMVDSALSSVGEGTPQWTRRHATPDCPNILVTHVPVNIPTVAQTILDRDADRSMIKYVQSGSPGYFDEALRGRVADVYTGHLHFAAQAEHGGTVFHMLPLGGSRDAPAEFSGVRIIDCP